MDTNNIKNTTPPPRTDDAEHRSTTRVPRWLAATGTGFTRSQCANYKFYTILAIWITVIGVTVAASLTGGHGEDKRSMPSRDARHNAFRVDSLSADSSDRASAEALAPLVPIGSSMPSRFADTLSNIVTSPELLRPVAERLEAAGRPLRILQIGDSHVAGRSFPTAVKETLLRYFGAPEADRHVGGGITFSYIGRNGATSRHLLSESYMRRFAGHEPDLIILSLGTNEAHGMGYREDLHEQQLDAFLTRLRRACPDAVILLTTPPGDYLVTRYVNYRRTSRSSRRVRTVRHVRRPNPMSARCASFLVDYAKEHGLPVWDMFAVCGGESSAQSNWVRGGYMRADRIHFEPRGYALQGRLLGEALARALTMPPA